MGWDGVRGDGGVRVGEMGRWEDGRIMIEGNVINFVGDGVSPSVRDILSSLDPMS